jgi:hypothetical protein
MRQKVAISRPTVGHPPPKQWGFEGRMSMVIESLLPPTTRHLHHSSRLLRRYHNSMLFIRVEYKPKKDKKD